MKKYSFLAFIIWLVALSCTPTEKSQDSGLIAKNAMVVSAHPIASAIGVEILKKGGNAVDAAIAVQFALAVVYPSAGNIGGGGFMVYRSASGDVATLDFREAAPANASRDMYLGERDIVVNNASRKGHLASGVPGVVDGMIKAHEKFGALKWEELLSPSIAVANNGYKLTAKEAKKLLGNKDDFIKYNTVRPDFVLEKEWQEGDIVCNKDLGKTLELIRDNGGDGFYKGETADLIVAEMERGNGMITLDDLANYEAKWREPIIGDYRGYKIISMPPPSSGGIALIQLLTSVEPYNLAELGFHTEASIHLMAEAERRVYADRSTHLGDADYYDVPVSMLTGIPPV